MTELSYALKNGVFTVNGVKANGKFASVSLLGIQLGDVDGSIDTSTDTYDFEANINVFNLLEAYGELQLKRANSGELMPNNLYFNVSSEKLGGISLVPPVPVVSLTGGGAGFYGLVDTINGDWYAIPPLKFRGTVDAEVVEILEAEGASIILAPSEYELSVESLEFAGTNFGFFSGGIGMYLGGDQVEYQGDTYKGLSADGKIWLEVNLPSNSLNFLVFDGQRRRRHLWRHERKQPLHAGLRQLQFPCRTPVPGQLAPGGRLEPAGRGRGHRRRGRDAD